MAKNVAPDYVHESVRMDGGYMTLFTHPWPLSFTAVTKEGTDLIISYYYNKGELNRGRSVAEQRDPQAYSRHDGTWLPIPDGNGIYVAIATECLEDEEPSLAPENHTAYKVETPADEPEWARLRDNGAVRRGPMPKYPFANMKPGDVFSIPAGPKRPTLQSIRVLCAKKTRALPGRYHCAELADGSIQVLRRRD